MDDIPRTSWYRLWEMLVPLASWGFLILPVVAAFHYPRASAIFIVFYVMIFFLRSLKSSVFLVYSFIKSKRFETRNWRHLSDFFSDQQPPAHTKAEKATLARAEEMRCKDIFKKWRDIYHVVIIATYKEEKEILDSTIQALTEIDYPLERIIVVLATEERDRKRAEQNVAYLRQKFGHTFAQFHHFMHPANVEGEVIGKGANITYSGRKIAEVLKIQGIDFSNVLVTTLDCDNRPHQSYFSNLTYHYLMEPDRKKKSYQPLPFFYNNIWEVPAANRLISLANSFWFMAESGESYHLRNASSHTQSLDALYEIDFWSRHTINEDSHQFWRSYFYFNGDYEVIPLFVPIYQDALQNKTYFTSLIGQYKQLRRWAWAVSDVPYVVMKIWKHRRQLPFFKTASAFTYLCYGQIMWATAPIIILLNKSIITTLNPSFAETLFVYNLSYIFNLIFTICFSGIIVSLWISLVSLPRPKGRFAQAKLFFALFQWLLLPLVTIIYGAIPAIDAQTRLLLGRPLTFQVTEKVRKIRK